MATKVETQRTLQISNVDDYLLTWLEAFLIDRKTAGAVEVILRFYHQKIKWVGLSTLLSLSLFYF